MLNELNVQSVVTAPAHDEMVALTAQGSYTVKGFAYSGQMLPLISRFSSAALSTLAEVQCMQSSMSDASQEAATA